MKALCRHHVKGAYDPKREYNPQVEDDSSIKKKERAPRGGNYYTWENFQ